MKLNELLKGLKILEIRGNADCEVKGVEIDSRNISDSYMFVAMRGTVTDGHTYIGRAVDKGATVVLCEEFPKEMKDEVTYVRVQSTEDNVGRISTLYHGNPSAHLKLVGVTGTNGKTTIATLLYNMFRKMGHKCGLISTVCNYIDDKKVETTHTTPDAIELNKLLAEMLAAGCEYVFMECSSHAIVQKRIGGLTFAGGIFTNLTRDHLDYHKTFENYCKAKKMFFDNLPAKSFSLVNADDKNGMVMVQNTKSEVHTYSVRSMADYRARIIECHFEGMYLEIDGTEVGVQFIGKFNVSNLLAVYGAARLLGKEKDEILLILSTLKSVSGRLEPVTSADGRTAVVDYAHTPDALQNVLSAINDVLDGRGRVITVCGAGGNRDKGKRPLMAKEAARGSDVVILTSDNPRCEDPEEIISEMAAGLDAGMLKKTYKITDRREAIRMACRLASKNDVILVAGKGHETYQEINGVRHHFDDREVLRDIFENE